MNNVTEDDFNPCGDPPESANFLEATHDSTSKRQTLESR
jgi:hypothetical protein